MNKRHQDMVREKIQTSQLINRLQNHVDGETELSTTQLKAAEILLNKSLPNLKSTEISGPDGGPVSVLPFRFIENESPGPTEET